MDDDDDYEAADYDAADLSMLFHCRNPSVHEMFPIANCWSADVFGARKWMLH